MDKLTQKSPILAKEEIYPGMFDLCRGTFMLLVVLVHSMLSFYPVWELKGAGGLRSRLIFLVYTVMVGGTAPMLYLCSGYGWRKKKMGKAVSGLVKSLLKPYLLVAAGTCAGLTLFCLLLGNPLSLVLTRGAVPFLLGMNPGMTVRGITFGNIGPMWCIVAYFLACILLNWLLQEKELWIGFCGAVLAAVIGVLLSPRLLPFCLQQGLVCCFYMYIGWLIKKTDFLSRPIAHYLWLACPVLGVGILACGGDINMSHNDWGNGLVDVVSGLLLGMSFLVLMLKANRLNNPVTEFVRWIGRDAFLFCCFHSALYLCAEDLGQFLMTLGLDLGRNPAVGFLVVLALNLIFAIGGLYLVKKLQARKG